jgi:hypothetical protein
VARSSASTTEVAITISPGFLLVSVVEVAHVKFILAGRTADRINSKHEPNVPVARGRTGRFP